MRPLDTCWLREGWAPREQEPKGQGGGHQALGRSRGGGRPGDQTPTAGAQAGGGWARPAVSRGWKGTGIRGEGRGAAARGRDLTSPGLEAGVSRQPQPPGARADCAPTGTSISLDSQGHREQGRGSWGSQRPSDESQATDQVPSWSLPACPTCTTSSCSENTCSVAPP